MSSTLAIILAIILIFVAIMAGRAYYKTSKFWGFLLLLAATFFFARLGLKGLYPKLWFGRPDWALWAGFISSSLLFALCLVCGKKRTCCTTGSCSTTSSKNATTSTTKTVASTTTTPDDLKKIEGIGPVLEKHLHNNGLTTYNSIANADPAYIKEILDLEGSRFSIHNPDTWPQQATLCAQAKWNTLADLQQTLKAGKTT